MDNDFIGVKIGDVNDSATFNLQAGGNVDTRNLNRLDLYYEDVISNIETVSIPVKASTDASINGMQFTIDHPAAKLLRIEGGTLEVQSDNYAITDASQTSFSWNAGKGVDVKEGEVLFVMVFEGDQMGSLAITDELLNAEAYIGEDLQTFDVSLNQTTSKGVNELYQNSPNPFNESTIIGFSLANEGNVNIKFYDLSGKVIKTVSGNFKAGVNQMVINAKELNNSGVIYYQLEADGFIATRKMIIID